MREIKNYSDVEYITAHKSTLYSPLGEPIWFMRFLEMTIAEVENMFFQGYTYNTEEFTPEK